MPLSGKYSVLSSAVRLANSGKLTYEARLCALIGLIHHSLPLNSTCVYLVDEEHRHLVRRCTDSSEELPEPCMVPFGEGIAGLCAAEKMPIQLPPELLHSEEWRKGDETEILALPLLDDGRLYGILSLGTRGRDTLSNEDHAALDDLMAVLSGIVAGYAIHQWADRRSLMMSQITDLVKILNRSLHPDVLVPQVLQACHRVTDSCCTILRLFPNDNGIPEGVFHKTKYRLRSYTEIFLDMEEACYRRVASTAFPILVTDLIADDDIPPSYICVPLLFEAHPMGTITFFGKAGEGIPAANFNEEERELFFNLATLMANALESGANYRKMVILSAKNQEKVKELSLLNRVGSVMLSTIKLNELVSLMLTSLTAGPDPYFERAMLFLIDENTGIMQGIHGVTKEIAGNNVLLHGDDENCPWCLPGGIEKELARQMEYTFSHMVRETRLPLDPQRNACSRAVMERRLIYVEDVAQTEILDREFVDRFGIRAFASIPLLAKERVIGVVLVDNSLTGSTISEDELRILQLITNQAGTAIENSILYSRIEAANRELSETHERLIQGERLAAIGEMAASIAHEVKGPLVSIGGFARRLVKKSVVESDEWRCADTIAREVSRLETLLNDILSYAKKTTICYNECSVVDIVEEALALISTALKHNKVRIRKHFEKKLPLIVADSQQIKQVVLNLVANAQEAMKGGGEIDILVGTAELHGSPAITITVSDTGRGIPQEILATIFNPFFTTKATGTGLGLPIIQRIVTNHMGKIEVVNRSEGGAKFTVTLPTHP